MIQTISTRDARFPIGHGHGSDAIHKDPVYSYAVTLLHDDQGRTGVGLAFTLGEGNQLVCEAARFYAQRLVGKSIEEIMSDFGVLQRAMADEQQFRWLGPHKGVVQLALASVTNACWDLWAKTREVPLWKLLLDLSPEQVMATLDLSYLEDELPASLALKILREHQPTRSSRANILKTGYPGYDTSVGWFNYDDHQVRENCKRAVAAGFTAMKLKVGSRDPERDLRRAAIVREVAGDQARVMVDANQQWTLPQALDICQRLRAINPFWIEEPTHPDDVLGHKTLADAIAPVKIALGEHVPNRIVFKNYLQTKCAGFIQPDAVRVAGVSEFMVVSLLCRKFGVPAVPHVGDMGQLHQHLALFNHIALGHEVLFLEHIPHLREHFVHPCLVEGGVYQTPQAAGASCDFETGLTWLIHTFKPGYSKPTREKHIMFSLKNKTALVTGAASGIGAALAEIFAQAGARVWIADRNEADGRTVAERLNGTFLGLDVANEMACAQASQTVGALDILANVAGIGHVGSLLNTTSADLDRLYAVNVRGVFNCCKAFVPAMLERKSGSVINMASIAGIIAVRERLAYTTTKFAVVGMTKALALDHSQTGVRFNCICPGRVETPFVLARLKEYPDPQAAYRDMASTQLNGRMAKPEEVAAAALYLAADESAMVTGSALMLDGGWSAGK